MRKPHPLTATKKSVTPRRMVFFDSEAYTEIDILEEEIKRAEYGEKVEKPHEPYLLAANFYDRRKDRKPREDYRFYYAKNRQDDFLKRFWSDVDDYARGNTRTWVFAHNAKYDMQVTAGVYWLVQLGYTVTGFSDANPFILKLEKEVPLDRHGNPYMGRDKEGNRVPKPRKKNIIILSSTNYYSQSLKSLGEIFRLPKLDFPHGTKVDMRKKEDREKALEYVTRDVEILTVAMIHFIEFIEHEDLGPFGLTVAGQAFTAFRHRFVPDGMIMIHDHLKAIETERRAYGGGRNECFMLGKIPEKVIVLDINSMYPYVMREKLYPTKLVSYWAKSTPSRVLEAIKDDYLVVCDAVLDTGELNIFHKREKRLIFPTGSFETTLTTPELIEAFSRGMVRSVKNVCLYEPGDIFAPYVDFFYSQRLAAKANGDEVHSHLYKIFLNSLYGKFGQKNTTWDMIDEADPEIVSMEHVNYNGKNEWVKIFGGGVFMKNTDPEDEESFNSFPAVAAHVTGYARMLIWSIIEEAGRENVYYTDTDSVFVNAVGHERLKKAGMIDSKRLGALKFEKTGTLWLNGCKDYLGVWETDRIKIKKGDLTPIRPEHPRKRPSRRRIGASWRWGCKRWAHMYPRVKRLETLYYKEIKIKGIPKNAVPLPDDDNGHMRFAVTQWGGFSDRLRKKDFRNYQNKVVIKTLAREYTKAIVDGVNVLPFVMDYDRDQEEQARKELEIARKEAAATMHEDIVRVMCLRYGFIRTPLPGERFYTEYKALPKVAKLKYFRRDSSTPLDVWSEDNGWTVRDLLDYLRG